MHKIKHTSQQPSTKRKNDLKNKFVAYILQCCDGSYYTGYTTDLKKRLITHQRGQGSKYVKSRLPFKLVYQEFYATKQDAMKREIAIKKMARPDKIKLIKA